MEVQNPSLGPEKPKDLAPSMEKTLKMREEFPIGQAVPLGTLGASTWSALDAPGYWTQRGRFKDGPPHTKEAPVY